MTHVGPLPDATIRQVLATVENMLRSPDVVIAISRGIKWRDNYDTGCREAEPTAGRTLTISVAGGAREIEETHAEKLERLGFKLP